MFIVFQKLFHTTQIAILGPGPYLYEPSHMPFQGPSVFSGLLNDIAGGKHAPTAHSIGYNKKPSVE
jgi:hypothetical protein